MEDKVIINAKCDPELKEAIRVVAFKQGHSNSSKTIVDILEVNPDVARALRELRKNKSKKVA